MDSETQPPEHLLFKWILQSALDIHEGEEFSPVLPAIGN